MSVEPSPRRRPVPEDLEILAEGLEFPEGPVVVDDDGSVIFVEVRGGKLSRIGPRGDYEVIARLGGGPNGAQRGPDGAIYVCNNGGMPFTRMPDGGWSPVEPKTGASRGASYTGGRIERVDPVTGDATVLYESVGGERLRAPNDLVFDASGAFWFTDTGKTLEDAREHGALYRASIDGRSAVRAAYPLQGPNGVGLSPDGRTLYVAETPTGRLRRWSLDSNGVLAPGSNGSTRGEVHVRLPGDLVFDSLAVDVEGYVLAGLPGSSALAAISPRGSLELIELPDLMPTNVAFGGPDGRRAYVTLGWTGRLASFTWDRPGLRLAY